MYRHGRVSGRQAVPASQAQRNRALAFKGLTAVFALGFALSLLKLLAYNATAPAPLTLSASVPISHAKRRPDILDRHGRLLATDIPVYWLYADPASIGSADETAEKLTRLFPDLDAAGIAGKLREKSRFEWIKRGLTPSQAGQVHALGLPGLHLIEERQRVYPASEAAAHVLGVTDVDNRGLAGIERYIDKNLNAYLPVLPSSTGQAIRLTLDLGVQHAMRLELLQAMTAYKAKAAFGLVMDVTNGEVLASVSLPDFDPNQREQAFALNRQNRILSDAYELGSVFKTFTIAMGLDQGFVQRDDLIDTRTPISVGRFKLRDNYGQKQMTVEDVFAQSSNTGTARIAIMAGAQRQKRFLGDLGLLSALETEAGPARAPSFPAIWRPANVMTVSYGHGLAVSPLAFASAVAAIVNGGYRIKPSFVLRTGPYRGPQVISSGTSAAMRDLMRLTVERGTGRRAAIAGINIGGKTGTAQKVKNGRYSQDVLTTFYAAFPIDKPEYLIMVSLDEPQPTQTAPRTEAAYNAAPAAGALVKRIAPMLNVTPSRQIDERFASSY